MIEHSRFIFRQFIYPSSNSGIFATAHIAAIVSNIQPAVRQNREFVPQRRLGGEIHDGVNHTVTVVEFGEHLTPGIDNHRVPVRRAPVGMHAVLAGGDDVGLVLDRSARAANFASAQRR